MVPRARLVARLDRLDRRRPAPALRGDLRRLTPKEQAELAAISATYGPLPRRANGRLDLSSVSDADLDALIRLFESMQGAG